MDFLCCTGSEATLAAVQDGSSKDVPVVIPSGDEDPATAVLSAQAQQVDFSANPIYENFMQHHSENFVRIHIHLVGVVSTEEGKEGSGSDNGALGKRRNRFGRPRVIDAVADPYIKVEILPSESTETGSAEYFNLASFTFPCLPNCQTPVWDSKCLLLVQKEALQLAQEVEGEGGILRFSLFDKNKGNGNDELLFTIDVQANELPSVTPLADASWTRYERRPVVTEELDARIQHASLEFSLMITDTTDRIVSLNDMENIVRSECNGGFEYSEAILIDSSKDVVGDNHAVLQSWTLSNNDETKSNPRKAVLWVLGRNDCFMHPHVAQALFLSQGYDLFVLNYKMNGCCRKKGFVKDPHFNSHNFSGNFDTYISDIQQSLEHIETNSPNEYDLLLGYAHSTGGPILLNYLMEKGDDAFDGFLFNSPFLDWGFVGGDMVEFVLENTHILERVGALDPNSKVGTAITPEGTAPLMYLGQEVVMSDWSARLWSLYYFDWATRPLYQVPMTAGFAKGVTDVHRKLEDLHLKHRPVTAKPFLCITSRGDDVLKAPETLSRADWIGPARWEMELNDNGHDIFLSYDQSDTNMAIDLCHAWMKNRRFA